MTEGPTGPDSESSLLPLHTAALLREIPVWESLLASFFHYFFLLSLTLSWLEVLTSILLNSLSFLTETGPPDCTFDNWPLSLLSLHLGPAHRCPIIGPLRESNWFSPAKCPGRQERECPMWAEKELIMCSCLMCSSPSKMISWWSSAFIRILTEQCQQPQETTCKQYQATITAAYVCGGKKTAKIHVKMRTYKEHPIHKSPAIPHCCLATLLLIRWCSLGIHSQAAISELF